MNRVEIAGHLAKRPEVRYLPSGTPVANVRLGQTYRFQDSSRQWQERTNWHSLSFYGDLSKIALTFDKVEALRPRHIVCGHQNRRLDDDAKRTIAETRQYLDDADELLRTENTAVGYFNAKIERYPDYLGRLILWVSARALHGVREHTDEDPRQIILTSWL